VLGLAQPSTRRHIFGSGKHVFGDIVDVLAEVSVPPGRWTSELPPTSAHRSLILHGLQDPGNVGTLIRSAVALGWREIWMCAARLLLSRPPADASHSVGSTPTNEKAVRASRGSILSARLIFSDYATCAAHFASLRIPLLVADIPRPAPVQADLRTRLHYWRPDRGASTSTRAQDKLALLLSSEAAGPSSQVAHDVTRVGIPLGEDVGSLNVAAAGAMLMWALR
jgi:TrmH family RNA methyltransferase